MRNRPTHKTKQGIANKTKRGACLEAEMQREVGQVEDVGRPRPGDPPHGGHELADQVPAEGPWCVDGLKDVNWMEEEWGE